MPAAVYFDDQLSSVRVSGCVFEQIGGRVMLSRGPRSHSRPFSRLCHEGRSL
jgi:hypothetical protein